MLIGISFSLDLSENSKKNINTMSLVDYDYWGKRGEKINYNDILLLKLCIVLLFKFYGCMITSIVANRLKIMNRIY